MCQAQGADLTMMFSPERENNQNLIGLHDYRSNAANNVSKSQTLDCLNAEAPSFDSELKPVKLIPDTF